MDVRSGIGAARLCAAPFARLVIGDALEVLRAMPERSVDLVLTSPPFLRLRSYLPDDDPAKPLEIGGEATPGAYIDRLLGIVEECRRVLAPHGSIAIELGDVHAGSGGAGGGDPPGSPRAGQPAVAGSASAAGRYRNANRPPGNRNRRPDRKQDEAAGVIPPGDRWRGQRDGWPPDKSLCMVPELLRVALAYGVNPLTGRTTPPWRVRNVIRWHRTNPPVGDPSDKFRPATTEMLVACAGRTRYFDLDAVRHEPRPQFRPAVDGRRPTANGTGPPPLDWWTWSPTRDEWVEWIGDCFPDQGWVIPTEPYRGRHYATWPRRLLVRPIEAMCPRRVCRVCGRPSERIVPRCRTNTSDLSRSEAGALEAGSGSRVFGEGRAPRWSDCGHDDWRPGVALDPFAGAGTTLAVAFGHGRSAIGIDLDQRNAALARARVGMWLEVTRDPAMAGNGEAGSEGA